jgi:uncharacterized protein DUF6186
MAIRGLAVMAGGGLAVVAMSDRALIITGFAALLVAVGGATLIAHLYRDRVATLGEIVDHLMRRRVTRILLVIVWAWLGWHFLAR